MQPLHYPSIFTFKIFFLCTYIIVIIFQAIMLLLLLILFSSDSRVNGTLSSVRISINTALLYQRLIVCLKQAIIMGIKVHFLGINNLQQNSILSDQLVWPGQKLRNLGNLGNFFPGFLNPSFRFRL